MGIKYGVFREVQSGQLSTGKSACEMHYWHVCIFKFPKSQTGVSTPSIWPCLALQHGHVRPVVGAEMADREVRGKAQRGKTSTDRESILGVTWILA
jgi:hypothetical protein